MAEGARTADPDGRALSAAAVPHRTGGFPGLLVHSAADSGVVFHNLHPR